jgi:hypothetical protein
MESQMKQDVVFIAEAKSLVHDDSVCKSLYFDICSKFSINFKHIQVCLNN